jgi:hypothetical protein
LKSTDQSNLTHKQYISRSPASLYIKINLSDFFSSNTEHLNAFICEKYRYQSCNISQVDKEAYQRLLDRLIYLCHIRSDISYGVSVVSRYMHDLRTEHMEVVYQIQRYLKGIPHKGLWFRKNQNLYLEGYCDADWASSRDDQRCTS